MSRYLRHLDDILLAAGIRLTRENRGQVHALVQEITGEQECPRVWRSMKLRLLRDDTWGEFVLLLRVRWRQPVD